MKQAFEESETQKKAARQDGEPHYLNASLTDLLHCDKGQGPHCCSQWLLHNSINHNKTIIT
jgi:hypothetical protein